MCPLKTAHFNYKSTLNLPMSDLISVQVADSFHTLINKIPEVTANFISIQLWQVQFKEIYRSAFIKILFVSSKFFNNLLFILCRRKENMKYELKEYLTCKILQYLQQFLVCPQSTSKHGCWPLVISQLSPEPGDEHVNTLYHQLKLNNIVEYGLMYTFRYEYKQELDLDAIIQVFAISFN